MMTDSGPFIYIYIYIYIYISINSSAAPSATYMRQGTGSPLIEVMACRLFGNKPLPDATLPYYELDPLGTDLSEILKISENIKIEKTKYETFQLSKWI